MHTRRLLITLALFLGLAAPASAADAGRWTRGPSMNVERMYPAEVLLDSGKILVVGGTADVAHGAEVYDALTETWTLTGPMSARRDLDDVVKLANGKVLAASGTTAELYDPATNQWTPTGPLPSPHDSGSLVALGNSAIIAGGHLDSDGDSRTPEYTGSAAVFTYSPTGPGSWTATGALPGTPSTRGDMTAVALSSNQALFTGGQTTTDGQTSDETNAVAVYTLGSGWSTRTGMQYARLSHTLTRLANGKVLAVGGFDFPGWNAPPSSEVYDPIANQWTFTQPQGAARAGATAPLLPNGKVLVVGGIPAVAPYTALYDPATNAWAPAGDTSDSLDGHGAIALPDGRVVVAGGVLRKASEVWAPFTFLSSESAAVFEETRPGSSSSSVVHVTNTGTENLFVGRPVLGGETPAAFAVDADGCRGAVSPGSSCTLYLTFTPTAAAVQRATLTFAANTAAGTYSVPLSGRGSVPADSSPPPAEPSSPQPFAAVADRDADGIVDATDRCSGEPGPSARLGCPSGLLGDPSIRYRAGKNGIRVLAYYVKATTGAKVVVKCSRGCRETVTTGRGAKRVRIDRLTGRSLANGTRITITVSMNGRLTTTVTDTIKRGRRIEGRPRCTPVAC